ncbi:hypothetical protein [Streptomyces sp. SKN60]|uniref:sodium:solute symporter family transporter n=1 Tax=Streptomyces sp. SKN60 TaxID=2855506 RepID=UPI0035AB895C
MFLLAEPVHSTGRFTIGDSLAQRLRPRPVYVASSVSTLVSCLLYLIVQMVGAGSIAASILGIPGVVPRRVVVCAVGILMITYVLIGGMRATTAMQMIKAVLLLITMVSLAVWVLGRFGFDPSALLAAAAETRGGGQDLLRPGARFGGVGGGSARSGTPGSPAGPRTRRRRSASSAEPKAGTDRDRGTTKRAASVDSTEAAPVLRWGGVVSSLSGTARCRRRSRRPRLPPPPPAGTSR